MGSTNTSTFQYAYLNSASQRPRLPCTPRSGKCTKQQQHRVVHRVVLRELVKQSASLPQLPQSLRPLFHVPPAQLLSLVLSPPPVPQASRPQSSLQPLSPATQHPQLPTLVQLLPSAPRVPSSVSLSVSSFRSVSST